MVWIFRTPAGARGVARDLPFHGREGFRLSRRRFDMTLRRIVAVVSLSALAVAPAGCGTLTGTAVGAGAGAAVGAGTGYGAGKGALIGAGVGAVGGAIYDITKKN
jgi:hypothetical protein